MPRARSLCLASLALLPVLCSTTARAQTIWIVDQAGGPGAQFTSIAPAIAAASDGDTIEIRPGIYNEGQLDVDKGLTILGEQGVVVTLNVFGTAGLSIHDLAPSSPFSMRRLRIGGQLAGPPVEVRDCASLVLLDELEGPIGGLGLPENFGLHIENCSQVHLHRLLVRGGQSVQFENTTACATRCTFEGGITGVMQSVGADITLDQCQISIAPTVSFAPPIVCDAGRMTISRSLVSAPTSTQTPHPAIATLGSAELRLDPTTTLTPTPGQPPVSGPGVVSNAEVDTLSRSGQGVIAFDLHARSNTLYACIATLPSPTTLLPLGTLWIAADPALHLPLGGGLLLTRQATIQVDTTALQPGQEFVVQAGVLDLSGALTLTNGLGAMTN